MILGRDRLIVNAFCAQNDSNSISNKRVKSLIFNGEVSSFHSNLIKGKIYNKHIFGHCDPAPGKKKKKREKVKS